jgi:hypothetical protein
MSNNIAIVGTRGAGKTVLVTMLAKCLSTPTNGAVLIPDDLRISDYVELNYAKLQRGEWPDSTNVPTRLSWKLRIKGKEDQKLTLLDCPGEDIQRLFAQRLFEEERASESKRDKELIDYLFRASKVLLLINLADFLDESYDEQDVRARQLREHSLKEFLTALKNADTEEKADRAPRSSSQDLRLLDNHPQREGQETGKRPRHLAVVFTAYNLYRRQIEDQYGSVGNFLSKRLPALWYEHFEGEGVTGIRVSAVGETCAEGRPKRGFESDGLISVIEWLIDPVKYIEARTQSKQGAQIQPSKEQIKHEREPKVFEW